MQANISALTRIRHLVSAKQLQIFTEDAEALVETQNGEPITPGGLKVITHTNYGVDDIGPKRFDGATLFVQRGQRNVRELTYDFNTDAQVASPVSILASHLIDQPHDMAVLFGTPTRPEQYAFFVNADGSIAVFHSIRSEELAAWSQMTAGGAGSFDSVCVLGSSVYFSTLRDGVWWLERFELDADDIWLDAAISLSGTTAVWNLGVRFASRSVDAMSNGHWLGRYTANGSGQITLPAAVTDLIAGYDYGVEAVPMPPDQQIQDGPLTGEIRRIVSATLHFHESTSASVNGREMLGFQIGQDPSLPPVEVTAKKRIRLFGYGRDPVIAIAQPAPGPLIVLGFNLEVSF